MHEYKAGTSKHVTSPQQVLAIAYSTKRRAAHRAIGGMMPGMPNQQMPMPPQAGLVPGPRPMPQLPMQQAGLGMGAPPGVVPRAAGGLMPTSPPSWQTRAEARNLMHTGPILSAVPGRTDRHSMSVPSGSYVLPADAISHLGQSNSIAGLKVANRMFGSAAPYGGASMGITRGAGAPRPPKLMGVMTDAGGSRGDGKIGSAVPVVTAGGEFVIKPSVVMAIGGGDINKGHRILDKWVLKLREEHKKTLKRLPPPAKA